MPNTVLLTALQRLHSTGPPAGNPCHRMSSSCRELFLQHWTHPREALNTLVARVPKQTTSQKVLIQRYAEELYVAK